MTTTSTGTMTGADDGERAIWSDPERAYRAVAGRDKRFDGRFILAVTTTGIYCRPSCPAMKPKPENTRFFPTAAAAQSAGFRACRRCLPDAVPGSPEWNLRGDVAGRAMRLISDGIVEREGVAGLAGRLGYSQRHVVRLLTNELGAGPLAMARAHRAHAARLLIETSELALADVAFAAGFSSIRQFNDTIRAVYACTPSQLRSGRRGPAAAAGTITLRLPFRQPLDIGGLFTFLADRAITGVESAINGTEYARTLRLPHGAGTVRLRPSPVGRPTYIQATLRLTDLRDLGAAVNRVRRLLDLDADPQAVDETLGADPTLSALVASTPGMRLPGSVDSTEIVVRAVIGQQVSVAAARTALSRLTAELGERLETPDGSLTTLFPSAAAIAEHGATVLRGPRKRIDTVLRVSAALASGDLDVHVGCDATDLRERLQAITGIGEWTAGYVLMRVLALPDELLTSDLALRKGASALNLPSEVDTLKAYAQRWRPWRSYAGMYLWKAAATTPKPQQRKAS